MCKVLNITRSLVYYKNKQSVVDSKLEDLIIKLFKESRNNYGTRKIREKLKSYEYLVSRKRIGQVMKKYGLVSTYTVKQFKIHHTKCNEEKIENVVKREFKREQKLDVVVSDLTYVNVKGH